MTDVSRINEYLPSRIPDGHWIDKFGWEVWVKDGKFHREDGPAIIYPDGTSEWYLNGKLHRTDGPAVERADGTTDWRLSGVNFYFKDWLIANIYITEEKRVMLKLEYSSDA